MPPAGIKTETPTATPTYLWTNRVGISHSKGRIIHHLGMMDHHSVSSIRFHPFSWRIHHGMIPFFTWTTKTHSPSNSNWWGWWTTSSSAKLLIGSNQSHDYSWLLMMLMEDPVAKRCSLLFFFWKLSVTRWRLGLFVSDGWGEVLETHTHTQFLPLLQRKWYVTWPKISDLEAIGIHTHDSHPVKIRLVIWQFSGWKFAPRSSLVRETGINISKIYVRLLQSPRHSTGQHAMMTLRQETIAREFVVNQVFAEESRNHATES